MLRQLAHASFRGPALPRTFPTSRRFLTIRPVPGVKHVVAVSAGKGGVGKSTTAVNLAVATARKGLRVGLLDVDIHGPSIPRLMHLEGPPLSEDKKIIPLNNYGITCMSMGFLAPPGSPVAWRGLMVAKALQQLLYGVKWGDLDILFLDMPPGTGDIHLTLCQQVGLEGAIIVTTPQDIALEDVRRGIAMYERFGINIHGVIENMSYFSCPGCGREEHIFGHGGGERIAEEFSIPLLGSIPLAGPIRSASDAGTPVALGSGPLADCYAHIVDRFIPSWKAPIKPLE